MSNTIVSSSSLAPTRVLVFGAGESAARIIHAMKTDPEAGYVPVGLFDDETSKHGSAVGGVPVLGGRDAVAVVARTIGAEVLVVAVGAAPPAVLRPIEALGRAAGLRVQVLPTTAQLIEQPSVAGIRDIDEADLLDVPPLDIDIDSLRSVFGQRSVLVTGAGGVVGAEVCRQLLDLGVSNLVMLDKDENALHELALKLFGEARLDDPHLVVADVRDADRLREVFAAARPHKVIHAAALTRRDLVDAHPEEGYKTNVEGTRNVVEAAIAAGVVQLVNLSTHHAADPSTALGATQFQAEMITSQAATETGRRFSSIRFGHVLGGRSSILTTIRHQVMNGAQVVLPGGDATATFSTAPATASHILQAIVLAKPGETIAFSSGRPVKLVDLAERLMSQARRRVPIVETDQSVGDDGALVVGSHELAGAVFEGAFVHIPAPVRTSFTGEPDQARIKLGADALGSAATDRILLSAPDVGPAERQALLRAFDSGWIAPLGPEVEGFEAELAEYVGAESCVALASGTAALQLGLLALGLQKGDEVVVQSATFAASAFAVMHAGAVPIFIDSDRSTWNLDPELLEGFLERRAAIGRLPKAVMPVDLYGTLADYERIQAVCDRFGVPIIEDAAEALGSIGPAGRMGGTFGALGVVSFNGNKIITTSGGGALFGPRELTSRVRFLATQAREAELHYEHLEVGHNARLSNLLAGMGRVQLAGLEDKIERRTEIFDRYRKEFPQIEWMPDGVTTRPNHWLSVGLLPAGVSPASVCKALSNGGVEARPAWKPMHAQPVFAMAEQIGGAVSDDVFARGICLPSGSGMNDRDLDRVVSTLSNALNDSSAGVPR